MEILNKNDGKYYTQYTEKFIHNTRKIISGELKLNCLILWSNSN